MHGLILALTVVTLTWLAPPAGGTPTGYKIHYGPTAGAPILNKDVGNVLTTTLMLDLTESTFVVVRAYNAFGEGPSSNEVNISLPGAPAGLTAR
jgi:hypothetical protein